MKISPFLTDIAKDYNPKIEYVAFSDLSFLSDRPLGVAWRKDPNIEWYAIDIDRDRLICPHQVLFVLYHELGHIVNYHLGYRHYFGSKSIHEEDANNWAFREMGMIDETGQVKPKNEVCYQCMKTRSKSCLKELNIE